MDHKSNSFLETEKIGVLMRRYAIPCIISLLVAALYNIVDQIFIANADYLGSYGNAANTVVYPLTIVALAVAVMIGDGCCSFVSISLGAGDAKRAAGSIGSSVIATIGSSIVIMAAYLLFMEPILTLFGGKVNAETYALSREYFFWITVGIPFYMFGQAMNPIIRSDGSPKFAMISTVAGAVANIILDPIFIYIFRWGILLQSIGHMTKAIDSKCYRETERRHMQNFYAFAEEIRKEYPDTLCLGAGGCRVCKQCAYSEPCRFPEKAMSSMEGYGLFVTQVCRDAGIPYHYGEKTITYTALVLVKKCV